MICVYAIAKNEANHVERWERASREADRRVIVDTGSTDATGVNSNQICGRARVRDDSANVVGLFDVRINSNSTVRIAYSSAYPTGSSVSLGAAAPWTWATLDGIWAWWVIEAA